LFLCQTADFLLNNIPLKFCYQKGADPADFGMLAENSVKNGSNASNPRPMEAADYLAVLNTLQADG